MLLDCLRSGWYKYDALNKQGVYDNITKHIMFYFIFHVGNLFSFYLHVLSIKLKEMELKHSAMHLCLQLTNLISEREGFRACT